MPLPVARKLPLTDAPLPWDMACRQLLPGAYPPSPAASTPSAYIRWLYFGSTFWETLAVVPTPDGRLDDGRWVGDQETSIQ